MASGPLDAKQNTAGRAIGHGLALVQAGSEIAGGLSLIGGGGGEAVVTTPACGTGVGCAAPAVGVGAVVGGVALTAHGTAPGFTPTPAPPAVKQILLTVLVSSEWASSQ